MKSCCFSGHRNVNLTSELKNKLYEEIILLINQGVTLFYSGGAIGWDTICSNIILDLKKNKYPYIKLCLILPCSEKYQTAKWSFEQKKLYKKILKKADRVEILSEEYYEGCMKSRNKRLVDLADVCICYCNESRYISGTAQTIRLAVEKGIRVINLWNK